MRHRWFSRIETMSVRTRLLALMLLFSAAVLVNILALVNLARSVSASLVIFESARERQLLALRMYQELSNAEAALYRYELENSTGFAAQFNFEIENLGKNIETYRTLATTTDEHNWASELAQAREDTQNLGNELIRSHDQQADDLQSQQLLFTRFSAEIFEARQLVISQQIQPLEEQRLARARQNLQTEIVSAILVGLVFPIALTIIAAFIAIRLTRTLDRNIFMLLRGADRVAAGHLDQTVQVSTTDELKRLAEAFNKMMGDLAARERGLQARLAELETLREVSLQITSTLDLDQVLNTIASSAQSLVRASSVQIFTGDGNDGTLYRAASAGQTLDVEPPSSLIERVANSGRLQTVHAPSENHTHSIVALPMQLGDQPLGVLHIICNPPHTLSSEDLRILRLLTDQATVALGNARHYHDLADREERVRTLMEKMAHIQDEERRLIGLDLHDGLTQLIISANMHLNALSSTLGSTMDARAWQELEASRALLKRGIEEARRVIEELRPTVIEDLGLAEGLRRYVMETSEANNWLAETRIDLDGAELSAPVQAAIFRIAQEALTNARKHSDTHKILVVLNFDEADLLLRVQDWGSGFDPTALPNEQDRLGLVSMNERARMLGGTCEINSQRGQGTAVVVRVPGIARQESSSRVYAGLVE